MRRMVIVLCVLALAGCVAMAKVEKGDRAIGERLSVKIEGPWNHLESPGLGPAQLWTMEGLTVDQLRLYSGIKDGEKLYQSRSGGKQKDFLFHAKMQPDEIVAMFEGMLTSDGSAFMLSKLEPSPFGGLKGFHFEFMLTRKVDNVVLSGTGWGAVSKGELFAMIYMAPRLAFFARHVAQVKNMAMSARVGGTDAVPVTATYSKEPSESTVPKSAGAYRP